MIRTEKELASARWILAACCDSNQLKSIIGTVPSLAERNERNAEFVQLAWDELKFRELC